MPRTFLNSDCIVFSLIQCYSIICVTLCIGCYIQKPTAMDSEHNEIQKWKINKF